MGIDDVEFSTLEWVDWFDQQRLFGPIGYVPPAEFETAYYGEPERIGGVDALADGQISPASDTTREPNAAPRRSEGLVSGADDRFEGSGTDRVNWSSLEVTAGRSEWRWEATATPLESKPRVSMKPWEGSRVA